MSLCKFDYSQSTEFELIDCYFKILEALRNLKGNQIAVQNRNIIEQLGEYVAKITFNLKLEDNVANPGFDAIGKSDSKKYQVKSRMLGTQGSRELGKLTCYNFETGKFSFDYLIVVYFKNNGEVSEIYKLDETTVKAILKTKIANRQALKINLNPSLIAKYNLVNYHQSTL